MFDMEQFEALDARFPELAPRLAYDFIHGGHEHVEAIRAAAAIQDWVQVRFHAHSLRTSAAYLGAIEVHDMCAGLDRHPELATTIVPRFLQAYEDAAAIVRQLGERRGMQEGCPSPKRL